MAQAVLRSEKFPVATSVSAYAQQRAAFPPQSGAAGSAPNNQVAVATATVAADGSLTFVGLAAESRFFAYALVNGEHRYLQFTTHDSQTASASELSRMAGASGTPLNAVERAFTETDGAGVYTASVTVPAGATIVDIIINGIALWTAATSATMNVGDAGNAAGYFSAVNLKATDLLAGESLSLESAGGKAGAYVANAQVSPRYSAAARVISGVVTTVGTPGNAGRTRMTVIYSLPVAVDQAAAVKV